MCEKLKTLGYVDEEHGILTIDKIVKIVKEVLKKYSPAYCYLFGSYASGTATETSNVNLLISSDVTGIDFFSVSESLREALHKKVDLLNIGDVIGDLNLIDFILKDGIKIM